MTLTDFLGARIAADEALIERVQWDEDIDGTRIRRKFSESEGREVFRRELAECEAKRRIAALHIHEAVFDDIGCQVCDIDYENGVMGTGWCETLRLLALPYADHADYDESWRP